MNQQEIRKRLKSFHAQLSKKIQNVWSGKSTISHSEIGKVQDLYVARAWILFALESYIGCALDILAVFLNKPELGMKESVIRLMMISLQRMGLYTFMQYQIDTYYEGMMMYDEDRGDHFWRYMIEIANVNKKKCSGSVIVEWEDLFWYQESHPADPRMFDGTELVTDASTGRKVIASRKFDKGELLQPYNDPVFCISDRYENVCDHCLKELGGRKSPVIPCEKCHHPKYCSQDCKSKAWNQYHSISCNTSIQDQFQWCQSGKSSSSNHEIAVLRMICMAVRFRCDILDLPVLKVLSSQRNRLIVPFMAVSHIAADLNDLGLLLNPKFDLWKFLAVFSKIYCNSFGTLHQMCIYSARSMLNHSCTPNVTDKMRVSKSIQPGDEMTMNYGQTSATPVADANAMRFMTYGFVCECPKCIKTKANEKTWKFAYQQLCLD